MKKSFSLLLIVLLFCIGAAFFSYPFISAWLYQRSALQVQTEYHEVVSDMSQEHLDRLIAAVQEYNEALLNSGVMLTEPFDPQMYHVDEMYMKLPTESAEIGYVSIPALEVTLPIYHTTNPEALELGAGHMAHTSLPIGGNNTHAVISAHCGLPNAEMFTHLNKLQMGNTFQIEILGQTLSYQIYDIETVLPDQLDSLAIIPGKDIVTLITCTPIGINSHRLLVHGKRIPNERAVKLSEPELEHTLTYTDCVTFAAVGLSVLFVLLLLFILYNQRKQKGVSSS